MTSPKRALAALALGALALPILSTPALADGEDTPPPPRSVAAFCAGIADAGFTDVAADNAFRNEINCIAAAEITRGLQGGNRYGPTLQVSRGQMASFIARMLDTANRLDTAENVEALPAFDGTSRFTDVAADDEHGEAINRLAAADIVQGGPGGLPATVYGSTLRVSRAQMASFVIRSLEFALDSELNTTDDYFTDDANAAPHQANINTIASLAIAIGDGINTYNPTGATSRGQMAAFIARSLAYLDSRELIRPLVVAQAEVSVTNEGDVAAGQAITGAITGAAVQSATVSGPCVADGPVTDTDTTAGGVQFSIPTSDEAAPGQCAVAFTVSFSDGRPTQTTTVNVSIVASTNQTFTVVPREALTLPLADEAAETPAERNSDNRSYAAAGLTDGTTYRITLVDSDNITVGTGGQVTFLASADAASTTGFSADIGVDNADITSVNGAEPVFAEGAAAAARTVTVQPVDGTITFTIDGTDVGTVTPVLYVDGGPGGTATTGGTSPRVEIQATAGGQRGVPTESFGIGGSTTFTDERAPALTSASPADAATDVAVAVTPTATFDEDVTAESTAVLTSATDDAAIAAAVSVSGGTITLTPAANLTAGATYRVTFTARDAAGNASSPQVITFTTAAAVTP